MFYSHKHQGLGYLEFNTDGSTVIAEEDDGLRHDAGNMLMIPDPFIETVDVGIGEVPVASLPDAKFAAVSGYDHSWSTKPGRVRSSRASSPRRSIGCWSRTTFLPRMGSACAGAGACIRRDFTEDAGASARLKAAAAVVARATARRMAQGFNGCVPTVECGHHFHPQARDTCSLNTPPRPTS